MNDHHQIKMSSDRGFGFVFTAVFLIISAWPVLEEKEIRWWSLALAMLFLIMSLLYPISLRPLNIVWFRIGLVLQKFFSPVIMGIIFFLIITPFGLFMRLIGKRPLKLEFDRKAVTYWRIRTPTEREHEDMRRQF